MLKIPQLRSCWAFVRGARATTSTRSTTIRHEHNFPQKGTNTTLSSSPTVATTTSRALTGRRRTVRNIPSETAGKSSTRGEVMSVVVVVVVAMVIVMVTVMMVVVVEERKKEESRVVVETQKWR